MGIHHLTHCLTIPHSSSDMSIRSFASFSSLILTAGALTMLLLVILGGTSYSTPLNQFWFLSAFTGHIPGAPDTSTWTLWNYCTNVNGLNTNCTEVSAAYPFDPIANFGTTKDVPVEFITNDSFYYYTSRTMFAFFIIAAVTTAAALVSSLLALCSRIGSAISTVFSFAALISAVIAAVLMTVVFVMAQQGFQAAGESAQLGVLNFGLVWAAVACLILATLGFCCGCCAPKEGGWMPRRFWRKREEEAF